MNCEFCGREEALPFVCNYCGGAFCADHRLPEAHQCKGDLTRKRTVIAPPTTTFTWSDNQPYQQQIPQRFTGGKVVSGIEIRDIVIAWLGLGFAFFLVMWGPTNIIAGAARSPFCTSPPNPVCLSQSQIFAIALATVGSGFVLHELSHKFSAQRYGFWAEFRMWPLGLVLALVTSLFGLIFAAPGATYIQAPGISDSENGKISLAGPLMNVLVAAAFLPFFFFAQNLFEFILGLYGASINLWLAMFNLIPIMPLDGAKVFRWNKMIWVVSIVSILAAYLTLTFLL